jgi:drug/metabolite transporter (DMT)-like permease
MEDTRQPARSARGPIVARGAPAIAALLAAVLFGAATPLSKVLLRTVAPAQLAGLLYLGAAVGLLPVVVWQRRRSRPVGRRGAIKLAGAIAFGGVVGPLLLLLGLQLVSATSVSLWLNMELVATAVLGQLFFREHLGWPGWVGVTGVALAGMILAGAEAGSGPLAAALVTLACVCWGLDNHLTALIDEMSATRATFWKCGIAGTVNLLLGVATQPFAASLAVTGMALVVGAASYGASIVLYVSAAQHLGATRAQLLFATAPFFGLALSAGLLAEPVTGAHLVAAALMVASIGVVFAARHGHPHAHAALAHTHVHRHDDGEHTHDHGAAAPRVHAHWHEHEPAVHEHPHWPDLHHRHSH